MICYTCNPSLINRYHANFNKSYGFLRVQNFNSRLPTGMKHLCSRSTL